jgi:hypothetical protein
MKIEWNGTYVSGSVEIDEDADVHEHFSGFIGALVATGFNAESIAKGLESALDSFEEWKGSKD